MNKTRIAVTAFLLLAASACASLSVGTDYDELAPFGQLRTYSWSTNHADADGGPAFESPLLDRHIRHTVDSVLGSMGYQRVDPDDADFRISYGVTGEAKVDVSDYVGGGYGYGGLYGYSWPYGYGGFYGSRFYGGRRFYARRGYYGLGSPYRYGGSGYAREYVEGTLVLDVVDAKTDEVVWRGWSRKDLGGDPKPENIRTYVNQAVAKILEEFPRNTQGTRSMVAPGS